MRKAIEKKVHEMLLIIDHQRNVNKNTIGYKYMPTRKSITKNMDDNTYVEEYVEKLESSYISGNNVQSLWERVWH